MLKRARTAAVLLVASLTTTVTRAQSASPGSKGGRAQVSIVLVHGGWADGSSQDKVIPLLQSKGCNVVAVHDPLSSLADDVATGPESRAAGTATGIRRNSCTLNKSHSQTQRLMLSGWCGYTS
jgi:hypothetical protein